MRIEKISFQAFGPYVNKVELAMDELCKHHLFLIKGATGAGKTVILDAITFALYGKSSSGERGDFESMRSRSADDKQKTFVELIFAIQDHRYRFYREIAIGKKRSGELLYKVNVNGGELLEDQFYPFFENCKMTLLEKQAEKLIGLNHAQFIRTMILPQGKFERLLISNSEEKQEILKSLFQSERWARLCDGLSEQLKNTKEKTEHMVMEMENLLAQAEVNSISECQKLSQQLKQQLIPLSEALEKAKETMEAKQKELEQQQHLSMLVKKKAAYEARRDELFKQEADIQLKIRQIETAKEYEQLVPYIKAYQEAKKRHQQANRKLTASEQELAQLRQSNQKLQEQSIDVQKRSRQCEELKHQCELWEQQFYLCEERNGKLQEQQVLKQQKQKAEKQLLQQQQELEQLKKQRSVVQQQITKLEAVTAQHSQLLVEEERWNAKKQIEAEISQQCNQLEEWENAARKQRQRREMMFQQEQAAKAKHEVLYQAYLKDSAGLLADMLEEGKPCPICGSTHHPNPAIAKKQLSEVTKLKECKQEWDHLIKQIQEIDNWLKQAEVHKAQIDQVIASKQTACKKTYADLMNKDEQKLRNALQQSKQAMQLFQEHKQKLQTIEAELPNSEQAYEQISQQYQTLSKQLLLLEAQSEERYRTIVNVDSAVLRKKLETSKQQIKTHEAFIIHWEQKANELQLQIATLQASVVHLKTAADTCADEYKQAQQELKMKNHLQLDIEQPLIEAQKLKQWKTEIQTYQEQLTALQASINELTDQIKGQALLPIAAVAKECETAKIAYQHYVAEITRKEYRLKQIEQIEKRITALKKEYEQALLAFNRQADFVKAMRGDTSIGIERYVLGIMLSHITRSANILLKNVHDGRYQLYRSDDTSGRVRKSGLELCIYDNLSGAMRSATSLSGGEKFLVSLALSLALSTVVQARNTGVSMESMFIDEGFGSLDEASIADALQVLNSMASAKTMIGIISHVELLKENIPYGIEVTKGKQESTCRMIL